MGSFLLVGPNLRPSMPKRPRTDDDTQFAMPGTPASVSRGRQSSRNAAASSSASIPPPLKVKRNSTKGRTKRDLAQQLDDMFGNDTDQMAAHTAKFDRIHLRPLAPGTHARHEAAKRLWIIYHTKKYGEEAAEKTLENGAQFPKLADVKAFIHFVATTGKSGLGEGIVGWSVHTTRLFSADIFSMVTFLCSCKCY